MFDGDVQQEEITIRGRIDRLHDVLTNVLQIEFRIDGALIVGETAKSTPQSTSTITAIENGLDGILEKASCIEKQLLLIEKRL